MAKAYVVGRLQRNEQTGRLELREISVKGAAAAGLTCVDGTYWCDFGTPHEGKDFAEASASAAEYAESYAKWMRLEVKP